MKRSLAVVLVVACSGSVAGPSATDPIPTTTTVLPTTTTTIVAAVAVQMFSACLADNGVVIETIPFDATGRPRLELVLRELDFTDPASLEALSACAPLLSGGALSLADEPALGERVMAGLEAFSSCVRSTGVPDFPDPIPGFSGVGNPYPVSEIPYDDPDLADAVEECRDLLVNESR